MIISTRIPSSYLLVQWVFFSVSFLIALETAAAIILKNELVVGSTLTTNRSRFGCAEDLDFPEESPSSSSPSSYRRNGGVSYDGNTVIYIKAVNSSPQEVWITQRSQWTGKWVPQLLQPYIPSFVSEVALSANGQTALVCRYLDKKLPASTFVQSKFTGKWHKMGRDLVIRNPNTNGCIVLLAGNGNTAIFGEYTGLLQTFKRNRKNKAWLRMLGFISHKGYSLTPPVMQPNGKSFIMFKHREGLEVFRLNKRDVWRPQQMLKGVKGDAEARYQYYDYDYAISNENIIVLAVNSYSPILGTNFNDVFLFFRSKGKPGRDKWNQQQLNLGQGMLSFAVDISVNGNTVIVSNDINGDRGMTSFRVLKRKGRSWKYVGAPVEMGLGAARISRLSGNGRVVLDEFERLWHCR